MNVDPQSRLARTQSDLISEPAPPADAAAQACVSGTNAVLSPVEMLIEALRLCLEDTYRLYAEAMSIPLDSVRVEVEGRIDLRGRFAVDPAVRPGLRDLHTKVIIDSPARHSEIERLRHAVDAHCPVLHVFRHVTPVGVKLEILSPANRTASQPHPTSSDKGAV